MIVAHTSLHARRRRLAMTLTLELLATGSDTTAIVDETPSPSASPTATTAAEASPEAGAARKNDQSPADQVQTNRSPAGQDQAGQSDQQAVGGAAARDATGFKADNPGWTGAIKCTGVTHGVGENYTAEWARADAMQT